MRYLELYINVVHYCLYKLDYKRHMLWNKLNPFLLLGKIPVIKRKFEERGVSQSDVVNKVWGDKRYGFSIMISGGGLVIMTFFIVWTFFLLLNSLFQNPFNFSWPPFVICMGLAYCICHYLVFSQDKYLQYFQKFDQCKKAEKWKYCFFTFFFVLGAIVLFVVSFRFLPDPT